MSNYNKYSIGDIIDDMRIIERDYSHDIKGKHNPTRYLCECQKCGRVKSMNVSSIGKRHGTTHKACSQGYAKKYPKLYYTWNASYMRIVNPNDRRYKDYGGRGLTHDFPLFIDFVDYMLPSYLEIVDKYDSFDITLDRIDNDKGYIRGNLRWATQKQQARNRRTNCKITLIDNDTGKEYKFSTYVSCGEFLGVNKDTMKTYIKRGRINDKYDFILG